MATTIPPISVSGKDFRLTPTLTEYVETKFAKLAKYNSKIQRIRVEFNVDRHHTSGDVFRIDVLVQLPSKDVQAGLQADDALAAVDLIFPKLERQLVKAKEKTRTKRRASA